MALIWQVTLLAGITMQIVFRLLCRLMFGFMVTTAFLSMWMSNTATAAMMLPIAIAVLDELIKHHLSLAATKEHEKVLLNSQVFD